MQSDYAKQYRDLWHQHWWWQSRRRFVLEFIHQIADRHHIGSILDIGCGDGLFFPDLSAIAPTWGIESDASLICQDSPFRERITICPFDANYKTEKTFDLIVMLDVLEHIKSDAAGVRRLYTMLNPGGYALLTVPALNLLWSRHDDVNHHFRRYTRTQLRQRVTGAGLLVERIGYYFGWTVVPLLLRRFLQPGRSTDASGSNGAYHVSIPAHPINGFLRRLTKVDHALACRIGLPIGSSLYVACRRPLRTASRTDLGTQDRVETSTAPLR